MKKVFVFGAGASCAAGAPLGNELVWRYHVDCRLPVPHITEEVPDNSEENERFRNYEKFLSLADSVWPDRKFVEQWRSRGEYVFY